MVQLYIPNFQESIYITRRLHKADKNQTAVATFGRLKEIKALCKEINASFTMFHKEERRLPRAR